MKIETCYHRGALHENSNEDSFFYSEIEESCFIAAVMDGCSTGIDSFFASNLTKKILQKITKTLPVLETINPDFNLSNMSTQEVGEYILKTVFEDTGKLYKQLMLERVEILSTLLLAVYDKKRSSLWINVSGDGFIAINKEIREFDQNNMPDFMGYHLSKDFNAWLENHTTSIHADGVDSFCLSTDGVTKFINAQDKKLKVTDARKSFLGNIDKKPEEVFQDLKEKLLVPYDDIAIIQVVNKK